MNIYDKNQFTTKDREMHVSFSCSGLESVDTLLPALKDLSEKMGQSETGLLKYWGVQLNSLERNDLAVL